MHFITLYLYNGLVNICFFISFSLQANHCSDYVETLKDWWSSRLFLCTKDLEHITNKPRLFHFINKLILLIFLITILLANYYKIIVKVLLNSLNMFSILDFSFFFLLFTSYILFIWYYNFCISVTAVINCIIYLHFFLNKPFYYFF